MRASPTCLPKARPTYSTFLPAKARLGIARACYLQPELCLLDEPLAALDPALCDHVWRHALRGLLSGSAVVITTTSSPNPHPNPHPNPSPHPNPNPHPIQDEAILQYTKANYKKTDPNFIEFSDNWVGKD